MRMAAAAQLLTELVDIGDQQLPALEPALVLAHRPLPSSSQS